MVGAKEMGIRLLFELSPNADQVIADKVQIQQVVLNLMRNSLDCMVNSPVRTLTVATELDDEDMVEVSVTDTGPGIDPEVASRLFQPFVTTKAEGMGVGLVDLVGRSSKPTAGRSGLNRGRAAVPASALPFGARKRTIMLKPPQVHLIDDDEAMRTSLSFLLDSAGLSNAVYASAEAFLDGITDEVSGCVITDIRMPGMSGMELVSFLKSKVAQLPVVVITGHGDVPLAVEAMKNGVVDFLEKPFDDDVLSAAIRRALSEHRAETEPAGHVTFSSVLAALSPR